MAKFQKVQNVKRRNVFLTAADIALINNQLEMDKNNLGKRKPGKKNKKRKNQNKGKKRLKN
jgi:hypothetical protein